MLRQPPSFYLHLIERVPSTKLPEGPWSASGAVADPKNLPRGYHVSLFRILTPLSKPSRFVIQRLSSTVSGYIHDEPFVSLRRNEVPMLSRSISKYREKEYQNMLFV